MNRLLSFFIVLLGLTLTQQAQAQLRVKPSTQSGTVGGQSFNGTGFDLTGIVNPQSGLFLAVSFNGAGNSQDYASSAGDSYFNMREFAVGKSTPSGFTYYGGHTTAELETWFSGGNYQASISGFFAGVGATQSFGPGVLSVSGSLVFGRLESSLVDFSCSAYNSPWFSPQNCRNDNSTQMLGSKTTGIVYAVAYAYPVNDWITVGVEQKNRSFSYSGNEGKDQTIDLKLRRIFVDTAFQ